MNPKSEIGLFVLSVFCFVRAGGHSQRRNGLISQEVFLKSFGSSQLSHKSVNLFFTITNTLPDLCGNWLLQNDFKDTLCEIKADVPPSYTPDALIIWDILVGLYH